MIYRYSLYFVETINSFGEDVVLYVLAVSDASQRVVVVVLFDFTANTVPHLHQTN